MTADKKSTPATPPRVLIYVLVSDMFNAPLRDLKAACPTAGKKMTQINFTNITASGMDG